MLVDVWSKYLTIYKTGVMFEFHKFCRKQFNIFLVYTVLIWSTALFALLRDKKRTKNLKPDFEYENEKVIRKKAWQPTIGISSNIPSKIISLVFQKVNLPIVGLNHLSGIKYGHPLASFFKKNISGSP